jgi:sigma-B regulation protein RsbU (phosphoserine phosphatase)
MDFDGQNEPPTSAPDDELDKLRRSSAFAREVVAVVSHDLRNPLDAILTGTRLAMQLQPQPPGVTRLLERVLRSAKRAERLVHDLLDYSQAHAIGSIPVHLSRHDVTNIARGAVDEAMLTNPILAISVVSEGTCEANCDADRLAQVLINLLSNAATHGKPAAPIVVRVANVSDELHVDVINENIEGPIPEGLISRLFEPFNQGRGPTRHDFQRRSIGLGLYIANQIMKGHDGRIAVESTKGATTFTVVLPARQSEEASVAAP